MPVQNIVAKEKMYFNKHAVSSFNTNWNIVIRLCSLPSYATTTTTATVIQAGLHLCVTRAGQEGAWTVDLSSATVRRTLMFYLSKNEKKLKYFIMIVLFSDSLPFFFLIFPKTVSFQSCLFSPWLSLWVWLLLDFGAATNINSARWKLLLHHQCQST